MIFPNALTWCNVGDFGAFIEKMPILPPDLPNNRPRQAKIRVLGFKKVVQCQQKLDHAILQHFHDFYFKKSRVFIENAFFTPVFGIQAVHFTPWTR